MIIMPPGTITMNSIATGTMTSNNTSTSTNTGASTNTGMTTTTTTEIALAADVTGLAVQRDEEFVPTKTISAYADEARAAIPCATMLGAVTV